MVFGDGLPSNAGDAELLAIACAEPAEVLGRLGATAAGLSPAEAEARLKTGGPNRVAHEGRLSAFAELRRVAWNPLNGLLLALSLASWGLGDPRAAVMVAIMVALSVGLGFAQEHRSNQAAAKLYEMVRTLTSVKRPGGGDGWIRQPIDDLVPGDIIKLCAGDLIPADLRLLSARDLHVNQAALTGESLPAEKVAEAYHGPPGEVLDLPNLAFMGSNVVSGFAEAVVLRTGARSSFGKLAAGLVGLAPPTSFDKGISAFTRMMLGVILVMAPTVFLINGLTKGDWIEALFFAVAVAVGLAPEMLPMIVTVNLAQGAIAMSRKKVIVKRLNAIQNFGAMDVLCTDKTGTLTENRVVLKLHLDVEGAVSDFVLTYAYLNSKFETGLANLLDAAVLEHAEVEDQVKSEGYCKIDELPFDFQRRRVSVVVADKSDRHVLICKGAVEEVFSCCTRYRQADQEGPLDAAHAAKARALTDRLNGEGFRVVAVAYREFPAAKSAYGIEDESQLTLVGYIGFLDPPKASAGPAIAALVASGVTVKVLTGDNAVITGKICADVGLGGGRICLGSELVGLDDAALGKLVKEVHIFAKLNPGQKAQVISALKAQGHVVGFLGDGINDGPSLKLADVGVSVEGAVDIAKESADIILLEQSLAVLQEGVIEGRRVFGNITKYVRMGASSNFGNMFSVLGASLFLPFLPMAPIQVLTNNLLYDFSQTTIPTDRVDPDYLTAPRKWKIGNLLRFMVFIGPISSIFDFATFGVMLLVFHTWNNPALFQAGWFVESLLTQTLIIHIIRTARIPFIQSRASWPLIATTILICAVGIALPYTWAGRALGFQALPGLYWPIIAVFMLAYATLTHLVKSWFIRRWGY